MKKDSTLCAGNAAASGSCSTVTLTLQDVVEVADGKICVYGDHLRTETIKIRNGQCRHTKIFTFD